MTTGTVTRFDTTIENFWNDIPADPVPAMITYGEDDINIGRFVYVHYQEPSHKVLEDYWLYKTWDMAIKVYWGSNDDLKELIAQRWPDVPMLDFGCSCCVHDLYEFNECVCGAPIGRHVVGCYNSFPRWSEEGVRARADFSAGWVAGREGRRCPPRKSVAFRLGYREARERWWKHRFDYRHIMAS